MTLATLKLPIAPALGDPPAYAPGPLSPAWPRPVPPAPPEHEWAALLAELRALRSAALASLRDDTSLPWFLTIEERDAIEAAVEKLKTADAVLFCRAPSQTIRELPVPYLPKALLGARDLASALDPLILGIARISNYVSFLRAYPQAGGAHE